MDIAKSQFVIVEISNPVFHFPLRIPTEFLAEIEEEVPETAILRGPFGCSWHVKIRQEDKGVFLTDGWENFRVHHSLVSAVSFLVFRYCGNWCFEVDIFADSGLEKEIIDAGGDNKAGPSGIKNKRGKQAENGIGSLKENLPNDPVPVEEPIPYTRFRATWDLELLGHYLDSCLEEAAKERSRSGNLTLESWKKVRSVLKEKTSLDLSPSQLLSRWNHLRRAYIVWSKIIAEAKSGEYDPVNNKIKWNHKQWKKYIEVNPGAKCFRNKSLEHPEKMKLLFGCYVVAHEDGGASM